MVTAPVEFTSNVVAVVIVVDVVLSIATVVRASMSKEPASISTTDASA